MQLAEALPVGGEWVLSSGLVLSGCVLSFGLVLASLDCVVSELKNTFGSEIINLKQKRVGAKLISLDFLNHFYNELTTKYKQHNATRYERSVDHFTTLIITTPNVTL